MISYLGSFYKYSRSKKVKDLGTSLGYDLSLDLQIFLPFLLLFLAISILCVKKDQTD